MNTLQCIRPQKIEYNIERFALEHHAGGSILAVQGWVYIGGAKIIQLSIKSKNHVWLVGSASEPSTDVADFVDDKCASNVRFSHVIDLSTIREGLEDIALLVKTNDGNTYVLSPGEAAQKDINRVAILMRFASRLVSLGDNCELGLLQRRLGMEPLGLLRFAGTAEVDRLIIALKSKFMHFADGDDLDFHEGIFGEWISISRRYGIVSHSNQFSHVVSEKIIREKEKRRLVFLKRKLLEEAESDQTIFIRRANGAHGFSNEYGINELHSALKAIGQSKLLWVTKTSTAQPFPGRVVKLKDGLYRGWINDLGTYELAHSFKTEDWIEVIASLASVIMAEESS